MRVVKIVLGERPDRDRIEYQPSASDKAKEVMSISIVRDVNQVFGEHEVAFVGIEEEIDIIVLRGHPIDIAFDISKSVANRGYSDHIDGAILRLHPVQMRGRYLTVKQDINGRSRNRGNSPYVAG